MNPEWGFLIQPTAECRPLKRAFKKRGAGVTRHPRLTSWATIVPPFGLRNLPAWKSGSRALTEARTTRTARRAESRRDDRALTRTLKASATRTAGHIEFFSKLSRRLRGWCPGGFWDAILRVTLRARTLLT